MGEDLLRAECEALGLPVSLSVLLQHIRANRDAALGTERFRVARRDEALRAIYREANDGTDDSHRRCVNIMEMVRAAGALEASERPCPRCSEADEPPVPGIVCATCDGTGWYFRGLPRPTADRCPACAPDTTDAPPRCTCGRNVEGAWHANGCALAAAPDASEAQDG